MEYRSASDLSPMASLPARGYQLVSELPIQLPRQRYYSSSQDLGYQQVLDEVEPPIYHQHHQLEQTIHQHQQYPQQYLQQYQQQYLQQPYQHYYNYQQPYEHYQHYQHYQQHHQQYQQPYETNIWSFSSQDQHQQPSTTTVDPSRSNSDIFLEMVKTMESIQAEFRLLKVDLEVVDEEDDEWKQDEVANEDEDLETKIDSRNCEYEISSEEIQEEEDVEWEQGEEDEEYRCTDYEEEYPPLIPNFSAKYSSRNCKDEISFKVLQEEEIDEWEQGEVFVEDESASDCDEDDDLEAAVDNLEWSDIAESELGPVSEVKEGGGQEGVAKSVGNMNTISEPTLVGKDTTERARIDNFMVQELEGTQNEWGWCKQKLGDNTILAVLLTVCKSGNKLAMQEFMIFPVEASSFKEAIRMGVEVVKRSELQSLIRPPPEPPPKPPWPQLPHTLFKPQPQDEEEDSGYGATHFCSRTISGRDRFQGRWS